MENSGIKFRAWRTETKTLFGAMQDVSRIAFHANGTYRINDEVESVYDNWALMQYTELHDSNGKEYCHKDIFRTLNDEIFVVEKNFGGFGYYRYSKWIWLYTTASSSEIIGDMFSNPELKSKLTML
jgi:hypothetical protein